MNLIQRRQQDAQGKHGTGGLDVAARVFQKAKQQVRVGIPALSLMEAGKVKEAFALSAVEKPDQPARRAAAQEA